jgi:hypothetical protein
LFGVRGRTNLGHVEPRPKTRRSKSGRSRISRGGGKTQSGTDQAAKLRPQGRRPERAATRANSLPGSLFRDDRTEIVRPIVRPTSPHPRPPAWGDSRPPAFRFPAAPRFHRFPGMARQPQRKPVNTPVSRKPAGESGIRGDVGVRQQIFASWLESLARAFRVGHSADT